MQLTGCRRIGGMSGFGGVVGAKVLPAAGMTDPRRIPAIVHMDAFEWNSSASTLRCVGNVLVSRRRAEIAPGVVGFVAVAMIDQGRPLAGHVEVGEPVSVVFPI